MVQRVGCERLRLMLSQTPHGVVSWLKVAHAPQCRGHRSVSDDNRVSVCTASGPAGCTQKTCNTGPVLVQRLRFCPNLAPASCSGCCRKRRPITSYCKTRSQRLELSVNYRKWLLYQEIATVNQKRSEAKSDRWESTPWAMSIIAASSMVLDNKPAFFINLHKTCKTRDTIQYAKLQKNPAGFEDCRLENATMNLHKQSGLLLVRELCIPTAWKNVQWNNRQQKPSSLSHDSTVVDHIINS